MKKILIIFILLSLNSCTGYERVFASKGKNFQISDIKYLNNNILNRDFTRYLNPYKKDLSGAEINKIKLEISLDYQENIISNDSKGDPAMYEMIIIANIFAYHNQTKIDLSFREKTNYNHQASIFDLNAYKKQLKENLIKKIINKIILRFQNL